MTSSTDQTQGNATTGLILLAHGSRDPLWRAPMEAVRTQLLQLRPGQPCLCAYLESCAPDLPAAAAQLIAQGVQQLLVLPLFLGTGTHARRDIPQLVQQLRATWPQIPVRLQPAVGEQAEVISLLAQLALQAVHRPETDIQR